MGNKEALDKVLEFSSRFREEHLLKDFKQKYPKFKTDPVEGVKGFLAYPFEARLGGFKKWGEISNKVIDEIADTPPIWDHPKEAWNSFRKVNREMNSTKGDNPSHNPLNPGAGDKISAIQLMSELGEWDNNIFEFASDRIKNNRIEVVYKEVKRIRGVGDKIARLFCRDVVTLYSLEEYVAGNYRKYCQPVDRWVERVTKMISGQKDLSKPEVRSWIVSKLDEDHIKYNEGAWYLGYHLPDKNRLLQILLEDPSLIDTIVKTNE